jgi:hypothetical protein
MQKLQLNKLQKQKKVHLKVHILATTDEELNLTETLCLSGKSENISYNKIHVTLHTYFLRIFYHE